MTLGEADESVHGHPSQGAHEELAPYSVGAANQHHLRVKRSEMHLRVLHPCERHLGPSECVGDCTIPSPSVDQRSESTHGGTPRGTQGRKSTD